ncbi:MAG: conjugal transfer protein TraH [Methylococcales bacterium]|nr:conjugal transfer protein TraH [Methylococcales bacterium]
MDKELQKAFSDMINVTPGGAYMTQRRGVVSGGGISMRNKTVHPNLISWVPPEIRGGCGGIDLFAGSFSFINGAQFTQLARSIAQGAVGYAFELAIEGMCPTCAQVVSKLQSEVAKINSLMRNSCETAKWAVDKTGLKAWRNEQIHEHSQVNTGFGYVDDYFNAKESNNSPAKTAIANGKINEVTGNVVYEALKGSNVINWFADGDEQLLMVLMSMSGTLITSNKDDNSDVKYDFRAPVLKVRDFIEGGDVLIYKCESDECLLPTGSDTETINGFVGLRARTKKMVLGTGICAACTGGLLKKIPSRSSGAVFTADEQKFIEATSPGVYALLKRLSTEPQSAALVADKLIDVLATELANSMIDEMQETVVQAVTATGRPLDSSMLEVMRDTRQQINEARRINGESLAAIDSLLSLYSSILQSMRTPANHKIH